MTPKTIFFAIDEVGSFAYLLPLFRKWLSAPAPEANWFVIIDDVIENFQPYQAIKDRLPLLSKQDALQKNCDLLVLSTSNTPDFTLQLIPRAKKTLAFLDIWLKVWDVEDYRTVDTLAVIDQEHATVSQKRGWTHDIKIVGQPAWENIQTLPSAPTTSILYAAQPIHKHYGLSLGYDEQTLWTFLSNLTQDNPALTLTYAVHPTQRPEDLPDNANLLFNSREGLETHGTVVSAFSSLLFDAWLGGRTTLSLQPGHTTHDKCYLSRKGLIPRINNEEALLAALNHNNVKQAQKSMTFENSLARFEALLF